MTGTGQIVTFYSFKGGTGRTMALANVAWILAANGSRVLVADWDLESPGLHRFFKPFLDVDAVGGTGGVIDLIRDCIDVLIRDDEWETTREAAGRPPRGFEEFARVERHAFPLDWDFPGAGRLDLLPAGRLNSGYAATAGGLDWDTLYHRGGAAFFEALRDNMKRNYDYTLIDSRTGLTDAANVCILHLPDTLVDCFTLSDQSLDGAAGVARHARDRYRRRDIRILPVPMRVDQAEKGRADAGRALAMRRFADLPSGMTEAERLSYWSAVEVPYRPCYAYEETLATFGDRPGSPGSLLSAFEALTSAITGGSVSSLPPMPEPVRIRGKAGFERRQEAGDEEVVLRYAPEDAVWAEWIEWILASAGVPVRDALAVDRPADDPRAGSRTLTVVSAAYLAGSAAYLAGSAGARPGSGSALAVYVADLRPLPAFAAEHSALLAGVGAEAAAERVRRLVGRAGPAGAGANGGPRYPADEPGVFNAPARNARFTGRGEDLRRLRTRLRSGGAAVVLPVALQGMGGVGKTQLAIEYVHRYRSAYDVVWWIPADPPQFVDSALADLGDRLRIPAEPTVPASIRAVLLALGRGEPYQRWLVVFDNAEDLDRVGGFLPRGGGHVLITSRNRAWSDRADPIQVDVFQRTESIAHLRQRIGSLPAGEADRVAEALGDLPIAVAAAGAWLAETGTPVAHYLAQIERYDPSTLSGVQTTWDRSLNRLLDQSPAAYRLLQLCSLLAPEIALDLIYSDGMAAALTPFDPSCTERVMRGLLVQRINRLALLKLDVRSGQAQVHRLLQAVVRDRMTEEELATVRHEVHLVLASCRPHGDVDDPATWHRFQLLWPHLEVSDVADCPDEAVRQLLIDRVRYLWRRGSLAQGVKVGRRVDGIWSDRLARGTDPEPDPALRRQPLHLRFTVANILREQGSYAEARELDEAVLAAQRELLGPSHPHTLMTSGGLAADLRALGSFTESLQRERATHAAWVEVLGEDHPGTLASAHNLALAYLSVGDFRAAQRHDGYTYERCGVVLGPTHPYTLSSASNLGRALREAGDYERSVTLLHGVAETLGEVLGSDAGPVLAVRANLAVSLRSAGRAAVAQPLLDAACGILEQRFGERGPETLACRLNRSSNLLALGEPARAQRELDTVLEAYRFSLGEGHPRTMVCLSNLAAVLRASGDLSGAGDLAGRAAEALGAALGPTHPFTLAARTNLGVCLMEHGGAAEAGTEVLREVLTESTATAGAEHPDTLRCRANLALALREAGERGPVADVDAVTDRLARAVGIDHPSVRALRGGGYLHRVVDPYPY